MPIIKKSAIVFFIMLTTLIGFWYVYLEKRDIKCKDCNFIMISLANVSAEHMSLYGYERLTTPNLDEWAKDAVVFENAFAQTSWTLPAATSLFTSLYPYSHKVMDRFIDNILDDNIQTLPEILRDQGYKTAAFTGGLDYSNSFGHMRGFEEVEESAEFFNAISFSGFGPTLARGLEWLEKNSEKKFFLFLHGYDAHCPFDPPEQFTGVFSTLERGNITVDSKLCLRGFQNSDDETYEAHYYREGSREQRIVLTQDDVRHLRDLYDEEVLSVDELVGNFLDALDKTTTDNTMIIVFSDHGEMFAKHGRFGRTGRTRGTLYDDVVHIPLLMKIPQHNGGIVEGLVQVVDILPTILNILDLPVPKQAQGKSLIPLIDGDKKDINEYVFAGSRFNLGGVERPSPSWRIYQTQSINESVRNNTWKLIHETRFDEGGETGEDTYELYDLKQDPDELRNLASEQTAVTAELQKVLKSWKDSATAYQVQNISFPQLLPDDVIEASKEHGYW